MITLATFTIIILIIYFGARVIYKDDTHGYDGYEGLSVEHTNILRGAQYLQ